MAYYPTNCRSTGVGPECSVSERGDGEKKDCLQKEIRKCRGELNKCIAEAKADFFHGWGVRIIGANWELDPASKLSSRMAKIGECFKSADCDFEKCYCRTFECVSCPEDGNRPGGFFPVQPRGAPDDGFFTDDPNDPYNGPGIDRLSFTSSSYDRIIEQVYGTHIVSGNVFWTSEIREVVETTIAVDGRTGEQRRVPITKYYIDFALGLCQGEIQTVSRIWIDEQLVYSTLFEDTTDLENGQKFEADLTEPYKDIYGAFEIFTGSESQAPSPVMVDETSPEGTVPGYRGLAYIIFTQFDITEIGGRIPVINVEVVRNLGTDEPVIESDIAQDTASTLGGVSAESLYVDPLTNSMLVGSLGSVASGGRPGLRYLDYDDLEVSRSVIPGDNLDTLATYDLATVIPLSEQFVVVQDTDLAVHLLRTTSPSEAATIGPLETIGSGSHISVMRTTATSSDYVAALINGSNKLSMYRLSTAENSMMLFKEYPDLMSHQIDHVRRHRRYSNLEDASPRTVDYMTVFGMREFGEGIDVRRFTLSDTDGAAFYDVDQTPNVFTIPAYAYGGAEGGVVMHHVFHVAHLDKFIFWVEGPSGAYIFSWTESGGIDWSVKVKSMSFYNQHSPRYDYISDEFAWIGTDGVVYAINLRSGVVTTTDTTVSNVGGAQYYNPLEGSITHVVSTSPAQINKIFVSHVSTSPQTLDTVVAEILRSSGLTDDLFDVSDIASISTDGYKINSETNATATLGQLGILYGIQFFEQGGRVRAVRRAFGSIYEIGDEDYGDGDSLEFTYEERFTQLLNVSLTYNSRAQDYQNATQHMRKTQFLRGTEFLDNIVNQSFSWPVVMSDSVARSICERILFEDDFVPRIGKLTLGSKFSYLTPGDMIRLSLNDEITLILEIEDIIEQSDLSRALEVREIRPEIFLENASIAGVVDPSSLYNIRPLPKPFARTPIVFPVPPPTYLTRSEAGAFVALMMIGTAPRSGEFVKHDIYYETSQGELINGGSITKETQTGSLFRPPNAVVSRFATDNASTMIITFNSTDVVSELVSATKEELFDDPTRNVLFVGREIIQFTNYSVAGDGRTVTFTGLLRGLRSTDDEIDGHEAGELCAYYDPAAIAKVSVSLRKEDDSIIGMGLVPAGAVPDRTTFTPFPLIAWNRRAPAPFTVRRYGGNDAFPFVTFHVYHRDIIQRELDDDDRIPVASFNQSSTVIAILSELFDPDLFDQHVKQLFDMGLDESVPQDTSYIKRFLRSSLSFEHPIGWFFDNYTPEEQLNDGIDAHNGELHIAVFTFDNELPKDSADYNNLVAPVGYNVIGRVTGFRSYPGEKAPINTTQGRDVGIPMHPTLDSTNGL